MAKKLILNLSTVINGGGAGNYALQNQRLLKKFGYDSYLVVKDKKNNEFENVIQYPDKRLRFVFPKLKRWLYRIVLNKFKFNEKYYFYNRFEQINCYSASTILKLLPRKPDVIFIYWVSGFINSKLIKELEEQSKAKIYILMIDNAPLTGGCHYPWDCKGYQTNCDNCPAISNRLVKNLARKNLVFKEKYKLSNASIVCATQTDYYRAKHSTLYNSTPSHMLFEIVDEDRFKPAVSKQSLKDYFNIKTDKKVLFFGATFLNEKRKGMSEFLQAINFIQNDNVVLLIAGDANIGELSIEHIRVGYLSESELIKAYQVSDLFVCPSLEDSGPLMINQSIMCGTPVVAFNMGSAMDLVITGETGYRAILGDVYDLAKGIDFVLSLNEDESQKMSLKCRELSLNLYSSVAFEKWIEDKIN